jgi:lipoprotein-anchoring transpeptidase ErfK/SrfK
MNQVASTARRAAPLCAALLCAALLCAAAVLAACSAAPATSGSGSRPTSGADPAASSAGRLASAASAAPAAPAASAAPAAPGRTVTAQAVDGTAEVYSAPTGSRGLRHLTSPRPGSPLVFQVLGERNDRIRVALAIRPDGSTGWIARRQVRLFTDDWQLIVSPSAHQLQVRRAGRVIETDPIGVGRGVSPTPAGNYYITELLRPPNPAGSYGPYAFGLSAYSPTLTEFAGGTGQIGLHGTNDPAGIGHDVSHGCIRVDNAVITRLAHELPLGTPVEIRG